MKNMNLYFLIGLTLFLIGFKAHSEEGVITIPLNTFAKPATDLFDEKNKSLSIGELEKRYGKFKNLSDLQPAENKYWQDKSFSAVDPELYRQMPSQNETVLFDGYLGAVRELGIFSLYIKPINNPNVRYGITYGLQVHASLLKAALLRKAGFYQESPKYIHAVRLKFSSVEKLDEFIAKSFCENGPSEDAIDCLSLEPYKRGFLSDRDDKDASVLLHGAYIEKMNSEVPSLFDGLTPANDNNLQYLAQFRAFRALAAPFVLGDVGESLNRYSPQAVSIDSGRARMNFMNNIYFDRLTSHDDMKWILDRYAKLQQNDWDEIVDAGQFPQCTVRLVKSLVLHRYKNMIESFYGTEANLSKVEIQKLIQSKIANITIEPLKSINTSCVKDGRVKTETIAGYPQRFSHGPRKSPFETADLIKYMKIATQSAVLQTALNQLNNKIQQTKIVSQKINGVEVGPQGIRLLQDVTGIQAGVNFNANRIITTGTFYGSLAPVQLVDSVSISAGLGAQNIFEGLNGIRRNYGASVAYIRSFTHVVPLQDMKQAVKKPWKDILVKNELKTIAETLNDPTGLTDLASPMAKGNLTAFLQKLQVGEVFTITDSIGRSAQIGWTSALDSLFGFVPGLSASLSFDASKMAVLRQVQITRTSLGLQINVRDIDSHMYNEKGELLPDHDQSSSVYGLTFDVNYYVNVFKLRAQRNLSKMHTDAFLIRYNDKLLSEVEKGKITPVNEMKEDVDRQIEIGGKAASALRAIIYQSNVEPLYSSFKSSQYSIVHDLKIDEIQLKLLWNRSTQLDQEMVTSVFRQGVPRVVDGAPVENVPTYIVSNRKGELRGRDLFGFSLEALNAYLSQKFQNNALQYQVEGQNPSNMPYGFAQWRVIRTDSDITKNSSDLLPTVAVLEHIWGGWSMKRKQMDIILNELKEKMKEIKYAGFPLIPDGALGNVDKVDFFKVTSHLSLLPEAINQVKDLVLAPEAKNLEVPKARFVARLFQKLSELGGPARAQDQAVFNNLIKLMGNGNEEQGRINYKLQCEINNRAKNQDGGSALTYTWSRGTGYECLEKWVEKIIQLSQEFPENDVRKQNLWITQVLYVLDEQIPMAYFLNYLGKEKYIYYVELTGFRAGDEDGDKGYYASNVYGEPEKSSPFINGLFSIFNKTYISPVEFDKQGSF
jgi:hypothetical protein